MKDKNSLYYIIIIIIAIVLGFIVRDFNRQQREIEEEPPKIDYSWDPETYVDPYGITTCYPSDHERIRRKRAGESTKNESNSGKSKGKYHYRVEVSNAHREYGPHKDLSYLNGLYEWDMDLYLSSNDEILGFIKRNYSWLKNHKVGYSGSNIYDEFNDHIDEYVTDPEDEDRFDPDIYDFLDDPK